VWVNRPAGGDRMSARTKRCRALSSPRWTREHVDAASFVPPAEIRVLRDYMRLRVDLTRNAPGAVHIVL
jgi:hypothetical protein